MNSIINEKGSRELIIESLDNNGKWNGRFFDKPVKGNFNEQTDEFNFEFQPSALLAEYKFEGYLTKDQPGGQFFLAGIVTYIEGNLKSGWYATPEKVIQ